MGLLPVYGAHDLYEAGMTTRADKRREKHAAARKAVSLNGTGVRRLSPEEVEELRLLLQPLVMQWQVAQGVVIGYLKRAGIKNARYQIDVGTGLVTLVSPLVPEPAPVPPPEA